MYFSLRFLLCLKEKPDGVPDSREGKLEATMGLAFS